MATPTPTAKPASVRAGTRLSSLAAADPVAYARQTIDNALRALAHLPVGAGLINVARGKHLVQQDLLKALETGQISAAVLDVTDPEPLPPDHPFWSHPQIMLTPHIASMTRPETAVDFVLETIRRHHAGLPLEGLVDRQRGY